MIDRRHHRDRRAERRFQTVGRIQWRANRSDRIHRGYISDSSPSGLAFVASRAAEPRIGELVELENPRVLHPKWKVVRIEDYDPNLCLVACAALPATPRPDQAMQRLRRLRRVMNRVS